MFPIRTILYPTDFSVCSDFAFRLASSLARDHGAHLVILHVMQTPAVCCGEAGPMLPEAADYEEALFKRLCCLGASDSSVVHEHYLRDGKPAVEILRMAHEAQCDLIVMGSHGRTGWERLLMGSVAEEVLRKAPCPVLTVKASEMIGKQTETLVHAGNQTTP